MRTEEFDAFGPWVLAVRTAQEVPPLFRQHPVDPASAAVVLKVPRRIDRRDADPTMHLYDHLLVVDDAGLTVLSRSPGAPGGFLARVLAADALLSIEESADLLDARLVVHAVGAPVLTVPFNGASRDTVDLLVAALRERWAPPAAVPTAAADHATRTAIPGTLADDLSLVALLREVEAQEPGMRVLAAHPRMTVRPGARGGASGALTRAMHALWPMHLQAAVVCSDGRELLVLHRRHWWVRGARPVHSIARTVLPLDRLVGVGAVDHPVYPQVRVLTLRLRGADLDLPVPAGSGAERALISLVG